MYHHTCALLALLAAASSPHVQAAPTPPRIQRRQQENSGGGGSSMAIGPQVWIPLVIIGVLFVAGVTVACGSRHFRKWSNWGTGAAQAAGASTGTTPANARELTADQLAGSNGNAATNTNGANGGTNRARRPRRTRRTPSQISTHSLPAYNKEPGEQEIVIVRGAEDMEDMPIPITVTMPVVDENGRETPDGSFDLTRPSSEYVAMPESPNDEPLLQNSEHHLTAPPDESATRRSFDSVMSSDEGSQVHYTDDAPPYEAIPLDSAADLPVSPSSSAAAASPGASVGTGSQQQAPTEQQPGTGSTRRRSMFMSIFNPRNSRIASPAPTNAGSPEPRASTHTREGSGPSIVSVAPSERDPRPRSRIRHRPSHSGSGSMLSLLRTRSRNDLAADRLTSPSMISLNSISSPLSHTLVRTDFTYPKSGPTPEQLKLISSRESFARFGVPYGRDAIAFAASTSRVELEPPPGFEEVAGTSGAAGSSSSVEESDSPSPSVPAQVANAETNESESSTSPDGAQASTAAVAPQAAPKDAEPAQDVSHNPKDVSPSADSASPVQASTEPSPSAPAPSAPASSSPPLLSPPPSASATSPASSNPPPSAFNRAFPSGSLPTRAASRASSYMTFATAEESLPASEPPTPGASRYDLADDAYESAAETPVNGSAPTTPRLESRHLHENTDTTITPGR